MDQSPRDLIRQRISCTSTLNALELDEFWKTATWVYTTHCVSYGNLLKENSERLMMI